jgi:hypothetical protein
MTRAHRAISFQLAGATPAAAQLLGSNRHEVLLDFGGDLVHPLLGHSVSVDDAEQAEDPRSPVSAIELGIPRDHVNMNVGMLGMFCEARRSLRAPCRRLQGQRDVSDQRATARTSWVWVGSWPHGR